MTTAPSPPVTAVQVLERDDELVVEIDLPGTEPTFTVHVGPRQLVVTVPQERPVHHEWHVNPNVVPD